MSDAKRSRLPLIALGAAVLAVAVSAIAAVVVLARDDAPASAPVAAHSAPVSDQRVSAADVVKLRDLEVVVEAGLPRGVRVTDAALAQALGLQPGDVITALSGRSVTRDSDVADVMMRAGTMRATTLYVEIDRGTDHVLVRWLLDGDLLEARRNARRDQLATGRANAGTALGSIGSTPPILGSGAPVDPAIFDTIEQVDDTHFFVPRATFEAMLANPAEFLRGARIVPAVKNGMPDGFKFYAIRPSSVLARAGIQNGDTLHSINGEELAEVDDVLALLINAKKKTAFRLEITRRGKPVTLDFEITK